MLRIRCPHCKRELVVAADMGGKPTHCEHCGGGMTVPLPRPHAASDSAPKTATARPAAAAKSVVTSCPRCRADVAPGTARCPRCHADLATGRRPLLLARLRYVSAATWLIVLVAGASLVAAGALAFETYRNRAASAEPPRSADATSAAAPVVADLGARLLAATTIAQRGAALDEIAAAGRAGTTSVAAALERAPERLTGAALENALAGIRCIGAGGDAGHLALLEALTRRRELESEAIAARACLGDARVAARAADLWLDRTRRRIFFQRLLALAPCEIDEVNRLAQARIDEDVTPFAEGLRVLGAGADSGVMERLLEAYWSAWGWLGQTRDERYSVELWEVAKPPADSDADFRSRIRAARRVLDQRSQRSSPSGRAAAGLVLANAGPQYRTLRAEIATALAGLLAGATPLEQQRLTWALAKLEGVRFADISDASAPSDVTRAAVDAAVQWARSAGFGQPSAPRTPPGEYAAAPRLVRRVVSPRLAVESALLERLTAWSELDDALSEWSRAGLGLTPRLAAALDPAAREINHPSLVAALIIACERGERSQRPRLELWRQAADQPAWVRGMAGIACARFEPAAKPAGLPELTDEALGDPDAGEPGWSHWGRLIAAGGRPMLERVRRTVSLSAESRDKLVREAQRWLTPDRGP